MGNENNMNELDQSVAEHLSQYRELSDKLKKNVDKRRDKRTLAEARNAHRQKIIKRLLWFIFLILCAVLAYVLYSNYMQAMI